jgi:putative endonuclease
MSDKKWIVYLLRCSDNSLYCGISNDINKRLREHNSSKGAKYTRSRRPVKLVGISSEMAKSEALKLEYRIKQLPAESKISIFEKEGDQMTISKDLKAITREIKALEKTISKLAKTVEKSEKAKPVRAEKIKKAPARLTATDQVLKILKGRKRGVTAAILMDKTGFNQKKVTNILQRALKQGKIKRVGRGLYVGA